MELLPLQTERRAGLAAAYNYHNKASVLGNQLDTRTTGKGKTPNLLSLKM